MNIQNLAQIAQEAIANPHRHAEAFRANGCGRVHVKASIEGDWLAMSKMERRKAQAKNDAALEAVARAAGLPWMPNVKGIHMGYDNNTGSPLHIGEAVARALTAAGLPCYMDADAD